MLANPIAFGAELVFAWPLTVMVEFGILWLFLRGGPLKAGNLFGAVGLIHLLTLPLTSIAAVFLGEGFKSQQAGYLAEFIPLVIEFLWIRYQLDLCVRKNPATMIVPIRTVLVAVFVANAVSFVTWEIAGRQFLSQGGSVRSSAVRAQCAANLKNIGIALTLYESSYGIYPQVVEEDAYLVDLVRCDRTGLSPKQLVCPESGTGPTQSAVTDYTVNPALAGKGPEARKQMDPAKTPWVWEKQAFHKVGRSRERRRNVLFLDGHVETVPEDKFQVLIAGQRR